MLENFCERLNKINFANSGKINIKTTSEINKKSFIIVEHMLDNYLDKIAIVCQSSSDFELIPICDIYKTKIFTGSINQYNRIANYLETDNPMYAINNIYYDDLASLDSENNNKMIESFLNKYGKRL